MHGRAGRTGLIAFDRKAPGLTGIAVRGFLLSLITFGIYRFWYITELRRFFWSRTLIDGSPAEYTGRGKELFLGFLVALAILIPLYIAIFVASISVPALAPFAGALSFPILFVLGQFALYRGRRYRASRTFWRGIRLGQDGSGIAYALMAAGWWLLTLLTFGLAFPFMRASLERYRIDHTLVGSSRMSSTATGRSILGPWLLFYSVALLPVILSLAVAFAGLGFAIPEDLLVERGSRTILNPAYDSVTKTAIGFSVVGALGFGTVAGVLLIPFYRARETKAFMNAASLGPARLASTLRAGQFYWPYLVYFLSLIGFVLLILVIAVLLGGGLHLAGSQSGMHIAIALGTIVLYLGGALLVAVLHVRLIQARLWEAVATTTVIDDADGLDAVLASSRAQASGLNEGMADALDLGGAIEIGL
ncbi:MAG: DUF898 domain-containing protein [Methylobacterium sp.]|uniref:YjgN family protein n=1 Tax=Methylobacterium sp. TaxID=409 RepID=UPI0025D66DF8|nr:YjgN family protein [Methylobacterium sp.]MBX9931334.1 DUF898 domain-containing protein [Methylobacterium sp.]